MMSLQLTHNARLRQANTAGFERHGNVDTPELKRRPEWLEKNWHKELQDDHITDAEE